MSSTESTGSIPSGQMQCQCCREEDCPPAECETDSCQHHSTDFHCHCPIHIALLEIASPQSLTICPECGDPIIKREEESNE